MVECEMHVDFESSVNSIRIEYQYPEIRIYEANDDEVLVSLVHANKCPDAELDARFGPGFSEARRLVREGQSALKEAAENIRESLRKHPGPTPLPER